MTYQSDSEEQSSLQALSKEKLIALLSMRLDCSADSLSFLFSSAEASEPNEDSVAIPDIRVH